MHSALQSPQTKPFSLCFFPQDIDGQALLLLTLPTVQECMELKLGPAIKLCHQIERVKVAFYAQYANWLHFSIPSCPPPCSLSFLTVSACSRGFLPPYPFSFPRTSGVGSTGNLSVGGRKTNTKKKRATNGTIFSALAKHMGRLLASLLVSLSNPLPSGARPAWIRWFLTKPNPPVADTFPRRVRRFQVVMVCPGQFRDTNIYFRQLWHSSFILKCKSSFVALPGV